MKPVEEHKMLDDCRSQPYLDEQDMRRISDDVLFQKLVLSILPHRLFPILVGNHKRLVKRRHPRRPCRHLLEDLRS